MKKNILAVVLVVLITAISVLFYEISQKTKSPEPNIENSETATENDINANNENQTEKNTDTNGTAQKVSWKDYSNSQIGISFKYPENIYGGTPRIVEDYQNQSIYLVFGDVVDIGLLREETKLEITDNPITGAANDYWVVNKPSSGWKIVTKSVQSENELNDFIKENYGSKCIAKNRKVSQQEDNYEIELNNYEDLNGNPTDLGSATCPVNYVYKILYYPKINKAISIKLGQECNFGYDVTGHDCYDQQMIDSIRLN